MNRILIVGSRGMLGTDLMELLAREVAASPAGALEVAGVDLPEIDITDPRSVRRHIDRVRPDLVINCAAWTAVDDAESRRDLAMRVNAEGAGNVASASAGARLVHLSTDFIFDGKKNTPYVETDEPNPLGVYAESKLAGERLVLERCPDALIVRTAWLYGVNGKNFVTTILKLAHSLPELTVVDDQRGSPTWTRDLGEAILALLKADAKGIVHAAGRGSCTWCDFAREIVKLAGLSTPVRAITSAELARPARRPANSALDCSRIEQLTAFRFPGWRDSLARFLDELGERHSP
jgi:dTDP-4-dehydrorhamnose reductase